MDASPDTHYLQNQHSAPMASFTDLRTRLVLLPVPQTMVDCTGCARRVGPAATQITSCIQLPACGGVTFVPDTEEWRRRVVLHRLGVQP